MVKVFSHVLTCDGCHNAAVATVREPTAWAVIRKGATLGWTRFGERDLCPGCSGTAAPAAPCASVSGGKGEWG